jgi:hypothetical protein
VICAVRVGDGIDLGPICLDALIDSRLSHKAAAILCGLDAGQWSRMFTGQAPMDLWKLRQLPWAFWSSFIPRLLRALALQCVSEISADVKTMAVIRRSRPESERKEA